MPDAHAELLEILARLERHYGDMQDTEFTVEEGRLFMLQTRSAKRPAQAAVRFAVDAVAEGLLDQRAALATIDAGRLDALLHPALRPRRRVRGLRHAASPPRPAPPAARSSSAPPTPIAAAAEGRDVILVRPFTEAEDVAGFHAARGILTAEGGKASHAALVARGMGRPCVCRRPELEIDLEARHGDAPARPCCAAGDAITIDGSAGIVTADEVPLREAEISPSSSRCSSGPTDPPPAACAPTPTPPATPPAPASSAPKGSASAAPSTCSWRPSGRR